MLLFSLIRDLKMIGCFWFICAAGVTAVVDVVDIVDAVDDVVDVVNVVDVAVDVVVVFCRRC